ncbi:MAG: HEPN domain-containing protein [Nitrospirae bacterium]|nr:HEPN domain-containing protein [Nitrospirota bacterium]
MTLNEKKLELSKYRIKQAEESLEEAKFLLSGNKSPRSIINRAYYAMFYSVLSLLVYEPYSSYSSSKHSGVLSYFNKRFIKEGVFPDNIGRSINKAFELRQRGDYREYIDLSYEQVAPFIDDAEIFVKTVKSHLGI